MDIKMNKMHLLRDKTCGKLKRKKKKKLKVKEEKKE